MHLRLSVRMRNTIAPIDLNFYTIGIVPAARFSSKAGHRSNLASLRFRVNAATERRKHTQVDFLWITRRFRTITAFSDQLGTFGRRRIHVHVTGDKTQE